MGWSFTLTLNPPAVSQTAAHCSAGAWRLLSSNVAQWLRPEEGQILKIIYLFIFRQREKRGTETSMCGCLSHAPYWGPGQQPRLVPWPGIEPATLWFTGQHSIHCATPARAKGKFNLHFWLFYSTEVFKNMLHSENCRKQKGNQKQFLPSEGIGSWISLQVVNTVVFMYICTHLSFTEVG